MGLLTSVKKALLGMLTELSFAAYFFFAAYLLSILIINLK